MGRTKSVGPTGRFAARYGATVRKRRAEIEIELKKPQNCPSCGYKTVKRVSVGIWRCRKCGYTFAGGAYSPVTKLGEMAKRAARGLVPAVRVETIKPSETRETM
jgi:large subunit ribosomal protein L37Ae